MKHRLKYTIWIAAIIIVFCGIYILRTGREKDSPKSNSNKDVLKIVAEPVRTANLVETIAVTGSFKALTTVEVVPEISGRLERLKLSDETPVDVGVTVKKGEVIAVIEHKVYLAQLAECQAAVDASKVALADAEREKKRIIKLFEGGSSTEQARDKAVTAAHLAVANLQQTEATLKKIKTTLDKATIRSPITGVVAKKYVDEGNMVGPGTPLVRIVQIENLKVLGNVGERYLPHLQSGQTKVYIKTDAYPADEFKGVVYKVGVVVDPVTRTGEVEIRVPNPDMRLKPGMFARMRIVIGQKENVTVVPDSALIRQYDNVYVFVVDAGKAHRRQLKLGLSQGQYYEVLEGLSVGDMVITHGQRQLKTGQAIEVVQETKK